MPTPPPCPMRAQQHPHDAHEWDAGGNRCPGYGEPDPNPAVTAKLFAPATVARPPFRYYEVRTVHGDVYWAAGDVVKQDAGWLTIWADDAIELRVPSPDVRVFRQIDPDEMDAAPGAASADLIDADELVRGMRGLINSLRTPLGQHIGLASAKPAGSDTATCTASIAVPYQDARIHCARAAGHYDFERKPDTYAVPPSPGGWHNGGANTWADVAEGATPHGDPS